MRSIFHVSVSKAPLILAATGLVLAVGGCGSTDTSRIATGAGGGAVAGAVVGGPVGAVVGGAAGAAGGSTLDEGLGTKADRLTDQGASSVTGTSSSQSAHRSGSRSAASTQTLSPQRVREVQQALNDRNSGDDIAVDGMWGPNTRQALRRFQESNGLNATGRLDTRTTAALNLNGQPSTGSQSGSSEQPSANPSGTSGDTGTQPQ